MQKLRIGVIDLVAKGPTRSLFPRIMNANLASIMPQIIALWCEQEGHEVTFVCYTGFENLVKELPDNVDLVFIGAFTEAAQLSYALSNLLRSRGTIPGAWAPSTSVSIPFASRLRTIFSIGNTSAVWLET